MSGSEPFGSVNVHAGQGSRVECYPYRDTAPILAITAGRLTVDLTLAGRELPVSAAGAGFARELARQAQRFAAECEGLRADQHPQETTDTPDTGDASQAGGCPGSSAA